MDIKKNSQNPYERLDSKTELLWKKMSDEVLTNRSSGKGIAFNEVLTEESKKEKESPLVPAFHLWSADNFSFGKEYVRAIRQYDASIESSQLTRAFLPNQDFISAALMHKAFAQRIHGNHEEAITTFIELFEFDGFNKDSMLQAGMLAEQHQQYDRAMEYYLKIANREMTSKTASPAEMARRAVERLTGKDIEYSNSATGLADTLFQLIDQKDTTSLRKLISKTHFSIGPVGGHTSYEDLSFVDTFLKELMLAPVKIGKAVLGTGGKRYLLTSGWKGQWFEGNVSLMITKAPQGWQWTGVALHQPNEYWVDRWKPTEKQTNDPLPFELRAPWPKDECFTAGGLWEYVVEQAAVAGAGLFGFLIAEGFAASSCCGWGPRGYYYNSGPTHDEEDAFAIDFTRYRRFVPYDNESGGTPVLAVRDGVVSRVNSGVDSGDSSMANRVEIEHSDPGNASDLDRFTSKYLHLEGPFRIPVSTGMSVRVGTRLGLMDDTGNSVLDHLHFSIHDRQLTYSGAPEGRSVRPTPMSGVKLGDSDSNKCVRSDNVEYKGTNQIIHPSSFAGQNWMIVPVALASNETPPDSVTKQDWMLVLSGVANLNLKGNGSEWLRETVRLLPDMLAPIDFAINKHNIPTPSGSFTKRFQVEQWVPHATLSSIFNKNHSVNSGFAVDLWRPHPFFTDTDAVTNEPVDNLFNGIQVDVAVSDIDAFFYRISYHITLIGKIRFCQPIIVD